MTGRDEDRESIVHGHLPILWYGKRETSNVLENIKRSPAFSSSARSLLEAYTPRMMPSNTCMLPSHQHHLSPEDAGE